MDKSRTELLIGKEGGEKLKKANIAIVGVGGVGGYVCHMLARSGIEKLTIVDFDKVSASNCNRQVVANYNTIGQYKVDVMKSQLEEINNQIQVTACKEKICPENFEKILLKNFDYVIDCIDDVKNKVDMIVFCKKHNINILSAMGAGNRYDIPKFYLTDIFKTHDDGLAKAIRKRLRAEGVKDLEVVTCDSKPQKCEGAVGSISYYPAMCGITISAVVINKLLKEGL